MKAIIAKASVKAGQEAEFEKIALELATKVQANEPGNKLYRLCKTAAGEYFFMELYESAEAMAAHGASDHMKEVGPKLFTVLEGRPEITVLDVLGD